MKNLTDPKIPYYKFAKFSIILALLSTVLGILFALTVLLDRAFPVRTLVDTGVDISGVLDGLDRAAGIPTAISPPTRDPVESQTPVAPVESYNLVLIGNDSRPGRALECEDCLPVHSDAFVYVNIVLDHPARITLVSLPRELYLHVDGIEPDSRINQLYARGGIDWVRLWSEDILGVKLDGVIAIEMNAFERIIDDLGGIDIVATESFRDKCGDDFYEYELGESYHLDGFNALCYARMRLYNPRGYFARQERHMDMLQAIFRATIDEFATDPLVASVRMVSLYYDKIESDMPPELIAKLVGDMAIVYFSNEAPIIQTLSMNSDQLELYPRANEDSPYLYKPTLVIHEWLQCILDIHNNIACTEATNTK